MNQEKTQTQPKNKKAKGWDNFNNFVKNNRIVLFILLGIIIISLIGAYFFYFYDRESVTLKKEYKELYTMVNDKVSQGANIVINLPDNTSKLEMQENIEFEPEISGKWLDVTDQDKIVFKPSEDLSLGHYYNVKANTYNGLLNKDFLVVDPPQVLTIFPVLNSEADPNSDITIVFNRPMIPLTTLDKIEENEIPIEIMPFTVGKFKWISTRTLQFIPETGLVSSSTYKVVIKKEFTSMDNLNIEEFEHTFITKPLRYEYITQDSLVYNKPIVIKFNQPVDLDKTIKEISLKKVETEENVEFVAQYHTKKEYNRVTKKDEEKTDYSAIAVYNKQDQFGREKLWNFNQGYNIFINKAFPEKGDIDLNEERESFIQITDMIASVYAESERSFLTSENLFDPQGKLIITFYEEIDLNRSKIIATKLADTEYGEKCIESEVEYFDDTECEKEIDKKQVILSFNQAQVEINETLNVKLEKIVNQDGITLNNSTYEKQLQVYGDLDVLKTIPANNSNSASLTEFIVCSNNPITRPSMDDLVNYEKRQEYIKANLDFEVKGWANSYLIKTDDRQCQNGQFLTRISVGFMPESDYNLELFLNDHFDQGLNYQVSFKTGQISERFLNFYHFQNRYNVTTQEKTKLTYAVENMEYIEMNICQLSGKDMLRYLNNKPEYWQGPGSVAGCTNTVSSRVELDKKYWVKNYFQIDLKDYIENPFGHYIVTFSHPNYRERSSDSRQVFERTYLTITNLSVVEKKLKLGEYYDEESKLSAGQLESTKNLYWVTEIKSLEPVNNAKLDFYDDNNKLLNATVTNTEGIAQKEPSYAFVGAVVSTADDSAIILNEELDFDNYLSSAYNNQRIYMYTDRPIYRPGHTVYFKGIYRFGFDAQYEFIQDSDIPIKVYNSNQEIIYETNLKMSEFGTFDSQFTIDLDAPLGSYRIEATDYGYYYFDVEEYVPAAFKVETETDQEEYIAGDSFSLDIDANYYFGAPVEGGEVEYSIASQDYYFDKYQDEYFRFGTYWYYCYSCSYGDKFILRNKIDLDKNGKANINQNIDFEKFFTEDQRKSKILVVYITVKNSSGQSVSTQKSFVVHGGEYYIGLKTDKRFLSKNEDFTVKAKTVDTEGKVLAVKKIDLKINKVKYVYSKRKQVDGGYYYKWEKQSDTVIDETLNTNGKGDWSSGYSLENEGEYEIIVTSKDSRGNMITNDYDFYVYGKAQVSVKPTNDTSLSVITDKNGLDIGEEGKILIKSPYEKAKALITFERGRIYDYYIVDIDQNLFEYSFTVKENYIPNIYASVVLLSPDPEVKFGKVAFNINTAQKQIDIKVNANKDYYLPGEEVVLDFEAKDANGNPLVTEFSAAVVDLSVLALKGNPKKDPLVFFYHSFPLTVSTASNIKNILYETDVPTGTKGGGGGDADDLAKKKRGVFKDTAFWQATIITDQNGKASVSFTLPDNLTTWQIESLGITKDTKLGVSYNEFIAQKELMAVPLKPRFVIPGDEFYLGAKIFNQTDSKQKLTVSVDSQTLGFADNTEKITLDSKESTTVYFKTSAPLGMTSGFHVFEISAKNKDYEDTVENVIKINPNETYEATATSGSTTQDQAFEYVYLPDSVLTEKGGLTVNTSATLAVYLTDALNYLVKFPYGCSEQVASRLNAIAILKKGLNIKNLGNNFDLEKIEYDGQEYTADELVELGLKEIKKNFHFEGGFSYFPGGEVEIYLSVHMLNVLKNLQDAGYQIDQNLMEKTFNQIKSQVSNIPELRKSKDFQVLATYTLSRFPEYGSPGSDLVSDIKSLQNDELFLNERASNLTLVNLALLLSSNRAVYGDQFKEKIFNILENRVEIDSRGAFLKTTKSYLWRYYESPIKNTALLLKAFAKDERESPLTENILRWLLKSRSKDGAWGSTNNTLAVVEAMAEYLQWQRETESDFTIKMILNRQEKASFNYGPENILAQDSSFIPVSDLQYNYLNSLVFEKTNNNDLPNNFYYDISLKYYLPVNQIPPRDEGFTVRRGFYQLDDDKNENRVYKAKLGDVLKGHLEIIIPKKRNYVAIEDFIPAGFELVNLRLATEDQSLVLEEEETYYNEYYYDDYQQEDVNKRKLYPNKLEMRDDRMFIFTSGLYEGIYQYDYYVRALVPGKFQHLPAIASEMYFPENFGRSDGSYFEVTEE